MLHLTSCPLFYVHYVVYLTRPSNTNTSHSESLSREMSQVRRYHVLMSLYSRLCIIQVPPVESMLVYVSGINAAANLVGFLATHLGVLLHSLAVIAQWQNTGRPSQRSWVNFLLISVSLQTISNIHLFTVSCQTHVRLWRIYGREEIGCRI